MPDAILIDIGTTSTDIIPISRRPGRRAGPHRPRAAAERRAGLHRRRADAGRGAGPRGAAAGTDARRSRPRGSRSIGDAHRLARPARTRRTTRRRRPTAGRPRASSPASGWRGWSAPTARCSTMRRSTASPGRSPRRRSTLVADGIAPGPRALARRRRRAVVTGLGDFIAAEAARAGGARASSPLGRPAGRGGAHRSGRRGGVAAGRRAGEASG